MQRFAGLFSELDQTNKTGDKIEAIAAYFRDTDAASAAWGLYFLSGQKLQRIVTSTLLRQWAIDLAQIDEWLFDECYEAVGDLAETISLIVPKPDALTTHAIATDVNGDDASAVPYSDTAATSNLTLAEWVTDRLLPLKQRTVVEQRQEIIAYWRALDQVSCLVLNKLLTGSFRVGAAQKMVVRGLALATGIDGEVLAHRMMGSWQPSESFYRWLLNTDASDTRLSRPYPFFLANPLVTPPDPSSPKAADKDQLAWSELGEVSEWQAEWKWDGIRAQVVHRQGESYIWSRGEELMKDRFPELERTAQLLPNGTVLDGEIVGYKDDRVLSFAQLQHRIGRKQLGKKILSDIPVVYLVFDILESDAVDCRLETLAQRRQRLLQLFTSLGSSEANAPRKENGGLLLDIEDTHPQPSLENTTLKLDAHVASFLLPSTVIVDSWLALAEVREQSRAAFAEGLMLKRRSSPYRVGRPRGDWWKWKIEPYTVDAVLIYAQRGHGKRASLYTDYTFAVWDQDRLVPFAKAYSGLTDKEIARVDNFVRKNTLERFGPVRSVKPELVFELAFENIQLSTRHKSGIAVRFPRILRWREDKPIDQADSIETIQAMLKGIGQ